MTHRRLSAPSISIDVRRTALLLISAVCAQAATLQLDHATVAGHDLKAMQAHLAAVGIRSEYGGAHANHATEMALTSFPDGSYLELIAIASTADAGAEAAQPWAKQMRGDAGPCAWAIQVKDPAAESARLKAAGVTVGAPSHGGRTRPDGTRLEWETVQVGTEPNGTFFPFLIHDLTPRKLRAYPHGKPTTTDFSGIKLVVIAVNDLNAAEKRYRQAFGLAQAIRQVDADFGAHLAYLGGTPVVLAQPLTSESWLRARIDRFGEGPCAFVLDGRKTSRYKAAAHSRWFGAQVSWFDTAALGWRLGWQ